MPVKRHAHFREILDRVITIITRTLEGTWCSSGASLVAKLGISLNSAAACVLSEGDSTHLWFIWNGLSLNKLVVLLLCKFLLALFYLLRVRGCLGSGELMGKEDSSLIVLRSTTVDRWCPSRRP